MLSPPNTFIFIFFLTVNPPKIIRHPKNQSVFPGEDVDFSIEATGDELQFKWQKNSIDLSDDDKYWGVNTDNLQIAAVEGIDEGDYRCLVKNDVGKQFSDGAVLSFGELLATATCICSGKLILAILCGVVISCERYAICQSAVILNEVQS